MIELPPAAGEGDDVRTGTGRELHEEPQVPNFGPPGRGIALRPGMTLAIEPMLNVGTEKTAVLGDNWTVVRYEDVTLQLWPNIDVTYDVGTIYPS